MFTKSISIRAGVLNSESVIVENMIVLMHKMRWFDSLCVIENLGAKLRMLPSPGNPLVNIAQLLP